MDRDKIRQELCLLIKRTLGEMPLALNDSDELAKVIQLDSFTFVSLILEIETHFDIDIPNDEFAKLTTVGAMLDSLQRKIDAKPAARAA